MQNIRIMLAAVILSAIVLTSLMGCATRSSTLPSWNDTAARDTIIDFAERVTTPGPDFVPESERIAVFDNDGCLWAEKPVYFQLIFAADRVRQMAPDHPEWRTTEPFRSLLANDKESLAKQGHGAIAEIIAATHAGMSADEFDATVRDWLESARHPTTNRKYTEMVYQPMLELLEFLRENGFKTYIVSGGGIDFVRVFSEEVYGIPPEQVVGSSIKTSYTDRNGRPTLVKLPELNFVDDKQGKPVGIREHIGRHPIFAAGNSDGDFQMLEYTTDPLAVPKRPTLGMIVHHTDADREWAYDRASDVGRLDRGLDEAPIRSWLLVNMRDDWSRVFPDR